LKARPINRENVWRVRLKGKNNIKKKITQGRGKETREKEGKEKRSERLSTDSLSGKGKQEDRARSFRIGLRLL